MNYCDGVPAIAVGLSAISFSAALQKDAAPIPNALAAMSNELRALNKDAELFEVIFLLAETQICVSARDYEML